MAQDHFLNLNKQISQKFFSSKCQSRYYQNSSLALYDICFGLQQFLSHKPTVGLVKNGTSLIESILPSWLRNSTPLQIKHENQTWAEYIESLPAETNFVVWSSENEITGEILVSKTTCAEIHERLSKKRIFSVQITHVVQPDIQLQPYSIILFQPTVFEKNYALVLFTEKMKALSLIGNFQDLTVNIENLNPFKLFNDYEKNLILVKDLEKKIKEQKDLYFGHFLNADYLPDRLVFTYKNINAEAIKQYLNLNSEESLTPASYPFWILDLWKNWWKEAESEAFIRGLFVVSIEIFKKNPDFLKQMDSAVEEIKRLSQWNVL